LFVAVLIEPLWNDPGVRAGHELDRPVRPLVGVLAVFRRSLGQIEKVQTQGAQVAVYAARFLLRTFQKGQALQPIVLQGLADAGAPRAEALGLAPPSMAWRFLAAALRASASVLKPER
jgi:hypothetical protein